MKITLVGDIFPADEFLSVGFGIRSQFEATKGERWKDNIQGITQDSDIVIGNLESPLLEPSLAAGKPDFYGSPEFARFLRECGIGVLNVANNHILEHGKGGYERTLQILEESGIAVAGNDNRVLYIHRDNCLIGIAGFCNVDLDKFDNDGCFSVLDEVNAMAALNEMADRKADLKILTLHWGNEYIHRPSMMQRNMAYRLIDAGADIIVGHHSHVIQPYEKYKAGHIFYSLGNFCFDKPFQSRQFSKGMGVDLYFDTDSKEIEKIDDKYNNEESEEDEEDDTDNLEDDNESTGNSEEESNEEEDNLEEEEEEEEEPDTEGNNPEEDDDDEDELDK